MGAVCGAHTQRLEPQAAAEAEASGVCRSLRPGMRVRGEAACVPREGRTRPSSARRSFLLAVCRHWGEALRDGDI